MHLPANKSTLTIAVKEALNPFHYVHGYDSMDGRERSLAEISQALDSGSNPSICEGTLNHATTAIIQAANGGDLEILALLLGSPLADVNVVDSTSDTALLAAARNGHHSSIKALLDAGADAKVADVDGLTPLMLAISSGCYESSAILANRAFWDWGDVDNSGKTLRELAAAKSKDPCMANIMHLMTSIIDERALSKACPSTSQAVPKQRSL